MRCQVLSDLHAEFATPEEQICIIDKIYTSNVDILILAGDILTVKTEKSFMFDLCNIYRDSIVLWVLGNHWYYRGSIKTDLSVAREIEKQIPNLTILENDIYEAKGKRFLGCTLWFENQPNNFIYAGRFNDFRYIKYLDPTVYEKNRESKAFLSDNIQEGDIVITHHMPSYNLVHSRFYGSQFNRFFLCDMEKVIEKNKPSLWISGHTHSNFNTKYADTKLLVNPMGYPGENDEFNEHLTIEV